MKTITNTSGIQGREWAGEYATVAEAAEAIRAAMGWDAVHIGDAVSDTDGEGRNRTMRAVYETAEALAEETDWASAPKVIEA